VSTIPAHVVAAAELFAPHARRWAPAVLLDPRVAIVQWMLETDFARSALFLGGQHRQPVPPGATPTYNVAGMVRHATQFDGTGPTAIYRAGREHQALSGESLRMPKTTAHHDGRLSFERQCAALGGSGWAQSRYRDPKIPGSADGSHLIRLATQFAPAILNALERS
jgi:hypothetical protein